MLTSINGLKQVGKLKCSFYALCSYSRQNMLSKSNANVPQQFSHEASPSAADNSRYTSSDALNNSHPTPGSSEMTSEAR